MQSTCDLQLWWWSFQPFSWKTNPFRLNAMLPKNDAANVASASSWAIWCRSHLGTIIPSGYMPSLVRLGCPNASRAASKFRRSSCVQLQCSSQLVMEYSHLGHPGLFGSFFCFFTCLPGIKLSEIRSITHTFAVVHTRSLSLSLFQSNPLRILIFLLHLLTKYLLLSASCRLLPQI